MNQDLLIDPDEIFNKVVSSNASDLHITEGMPPLIRISGVLEPLPGYHSFSDEEVKTFIKKILNEEQLKKFETDKELDFSHALEGKGRFRVNIFSQKNTWALAARLIPLHVPTLEELNIPSIIYEFCKLPQGLVLVTGATGTGKSTTLAGMVNWINENRNAHIITIEDPIEFVFESKNSLIHQREMYVDTLSWTNALKAALREDPNVILVGEMRDYETISAAITAAETGHLVLATLHTNSASQTIDRIIDVFPEHQQDQIRIQLAAVLEGVMTQTLVRSSNGETRYPAIEILIANTAVKNTIREGNVHYIDNIIRTSLDLGMRNIERSLADLVLEGKIEMEEAQAKSLNPDEIVRYLQHKNK